MDVVGPVNRSLPFGRLVVGLLKLGAGGLGSNFSPSGLFKSVNGASEIALCP
jgi:hypothetical protein